MSSFTKFKKDTSSVPGVRTSFRNGQICSTGNDSFDFVIGGGIELNSILLVGEDKYRRYSDILAKLFLADAFHHNNQILLVDLSDDPRKFMKDIPARNESLKEEVPQEPLNDELRIAFRYQDLPKIDSVQRSNQNINNYDLAKKCDKEKVENYKNISYLSFAECVKRANNSERNFFNIIGDEIQSLAQKNQENLLRICVRSLGSPNWYSDTFSSDILSFIFRLKSIVRYNSNITCFITIPFHLINLLDDQLMYKISKATDIYVNLESFDDIEKQTNSVFKQYHGLLHIKKMETLTSLQPHKPEAFDLAFKLKSHKLIIEKLHLPPELQENESNEFSMSCSSTTRSGNKSLDF